MIRNLKILVAAAMALGVLGAFSASGAQAAEFHCSVEPCAGRLKPDETTGTKTAHHVFVVENLTTTEAVSFTCSSLSGKGTVAVKKTTTEVEVGGAVGSASALVYSECTINGSPGVTFDMNGCKYNFTVAGNVSITGCTNAAKQIEVTIPECTFDIPEQGPLSGVTYHTIGTTPNREVTVSTNVHNIKINATGSTSGCKINPSQTLTVTDTTANSIVTGETPFGVMADAWWE